MHCRGIAGFKAGYWFLSPKKRPGRKLNTMRAGYVALLSVVLSYSAYRGTNSSPGGQASGTNPSASEAMRSPARVAHPLVGPNSFPTITGGICPLNFDHGDPCDGCKSICPAQDLKSLIEDYFRGQSRKDDSFPQSHWNVPRSQQEHIQFIFASTPDPVHTHMALVFDREIETIQSAAQSAGFLFARAWMPWDISVHNESTDFTIRLAQSKLRDQLENLPGVMIFQKFNDEGPPTILFVFITGETSTGGIHIEQFENALKIRKAILDGANPNFSELKTLRIFGPVFSGSLRSLNVILNADAHRQFDRIVVRSGSVSSDLAVRQFCSQTSHEWPDLKTGKPPADRPNFETLQVTDAYQDFYLAAYFHKFANREGPHFNMAVVSEDETAFGNQPENGSDVPKQAGSTTHSGSSSCGGAEAPASHDFLRLYYPREIAQLRDAYQQNLKAQVASDSGKAAPQSGLPLSLSVTGNDDDTVAPFSPLQTPLSQETILQGIVISLRMTHAKVVVIRAGDPLDILFLAHYLRQNYPQARLVTVGADLLMIHAFFDPRFHGILAVTTYPLLVETDFPNSGSEPRLERVFSDSYSVGDFNAFQALLVPGKEPPNDQLPMANYAQFGLPSFLQPKNADQKTVAWPAHLWLTAVGRDGYWPVAVLDDPNQGFELRIPHVDHGAVSPKTFAVHFSLGWTLFSTLALCLTLLLAGLVAFPPKGTRSEVLARFGLRKSPERNDLLFAPGVLLLAVQVALVVPSIFWLGRFSEVEKQGSFKDVPEYFNGLHFNMLAYLISVGALGAGFYIGFRKRGAPRFAQVGSALCAVSLVGVITLSIVFWSTDLGTDLGVFVYRYVHVGSGVSPLLPILFLLSAWIWWCWQSLTGVVSTEEKQIALPSKCSFDKPFERDASSRVRLKMLAAGDNEWPWKNLRCIPGWKIIGYAFLALVVILVFMRPDEIAEAFESQIYKRIFWVLLYSCLFLVLYLTIHIVALWLDFRSLLRHIEMVPFRRGFTALKALTWKPLWKLAGNGRDQFVQLLQEEVDALIRIENSDLADWPLHRAIVGTKEALKEVSAEFERNPSNGKVHDLFGALQVSLANAASEALIYANEQWEKEPFTPPSDKSDSKDSHADRGTFEPAAEDRTLGAVEHFLCLFYLNIILVPLRRLQTLILALAGVFIFVLVSYSSYPFESRESFHALLISVFFGISLVVGIVYGQMFANPLLSRITNTKPGELGLDFWVRLGTFVFIPLLSLLSVQFPEINNFLFSWLQPALQSIK